MVYVTRQMKFSASHRLFNPTFSDEKNEAVFDKCNNPNGHGHNYTLEVTVAGLPDPDTGYVFDLKRLKKILEKEIISKVDHKNLNLDVNFLKGVIPTVENLAISFWGILNKVLGEKKLYKIKLYESDTSFVEYFGEPADIKKFK